MTVVPAGSGDLAAYLGELGDDIGFEDMDATDLRIPRITIIGPEAVWKDSLSGDKFDVLDCVIYGVVKQRIMWPDTTDEGDKPQCKSTQFSIGLPNMRTDIPPKKRFPWAEAGFTPDQAVPIDLAPGQDPTLPNGWTSNGLPALPCASCRMKEWGADKTPPACAETYLYILEYSRDGWATSSPALLALQRSSMKNCKAYNSHFMQAKMPMFTAYTRITLKPQSRGSVLYAVPEFAKCESTDPTNWRGYADTLRSIREFVRQAPRPQDDEDESGTPPPPAGNVNQAPAPTEDPWAPAPETAAVPAQPVAAAPVAAPPAPAPAPAAPPVAPPAPVAAAPVTAPPAPVAPPAPPVPPAAPAAQPAAVAPAAAPVAAPVSDDDDLPF